MDVKILQKLTAIKQKFRSLPPQDREKLGIALLKINLGVNGEDDRSLAKTFIEDLHIDLKEDRLEAFMNFLHSTSSNIPAELLDHSPRDIIHSEIEKQISEKFRKSDLKTYNEDELETLKDYPKPFHKG